MYNVTGHTLTQGINGNARPKSYVYKDGGDTLFEKEYLELLTTKKATGIYIDPDCRNDVGKTSYYTDLTWFLKSQEKKYASLYSFLAPRKVSGEDDKSNKNADDYKITVIKNGKALMRLTSDQFGFNAAETIYNSDKYPLARLLNSPPEDRSLEEVKQFIVTYVKNTRTIGGAFVWPLPLEGRRICLYNTNRGIKGYLQDRVDLTLLEIKHVFDKGYDEGRYKSDLLYSLYCNEKTQLKEWFQHFNSFAEYIEYFMLEPFVNNVKGQMMPINIIRDEPIDEEDVKDQKKCKDKLQNLRSEELIEMLKRLQVMILKRSKNMEAACYRIHCFGE